MPNEDFTLIETVCGKWVKAEKGVERGTFAIELSESILITIHVSTNSIDFYTKDKDDIYTYLGDQTFEISQSNALSIWLHASRFESVLLGRKQVPVTEPLDIIHDLTVLLTAEATKQDNIKILPLSGKIDVPPKPTES